MEYTGKEIVEKTGVALRTIRLWVERGIVPKPLGRGAGTRYSEEHRIVIAAIAEFRRQGNVYLDVIGNEMKKRSLDDLRELIGEPRQDAAPEEAKPAAQQLPPPPAARELPPAQALAFPASASRLAIVPLLPNLALMVGENASAVVQRIAAEIIEKYGQG